MNKVDELKKEEEILQENAKKIILNKNWKLIDQEYLIISNYYQFGTGDLIFRNNNKILIIECKYINFKKKGRNYRSKRTKARKKVKEQALYYSSCAKLKYRNCCVYGSIFTNENNKIKIICKIDSLIKARNNFEYFFKKQHKISYFNEDIIKKLKEFIKLN